MTLNQSLKNLLANKDDTLRRHREIVELLHESRFLDWLRAMSGVQLFSPNDPTHVQANKGAFSAGYKQCIEDLVNFGDQYITNPVAPGKMPGLDYGARAALANLYTPEEIAEARKNPIR